ncbi:hypothetical protein [Amycolatopsis sp. YIM 10]|uniref:hypothetical protein n=1 Tax=Amycolatopsis sp. YIM 10 TaxID=2653857 RepID=UPI00128FD201|nr:hypothetical protein [Amycolatopsis sp. YIM 10]QFU85441.1 hypothetical protein YIM_01040 [Amycolatopsis sp. YIM 10]
MAGGYTFDADAMADRIRQLEDVRNRIRDQHQVLGKRSWIEPPSNDDPAKAQVKATLVSIAIAAGHNLAMYQYADAYLGKLYEAAGRYGAQEESTGALFEK